MSEIVLLAWWPFTYKLTDECDKTNKLSFNFFTKEII